MKRILLSLLLIVLSTASYAQLRVGIKAMLTSNSLHVNPDSSVAETDMIRGNAGIMANYRFSKRFSLQAELNFTTHGKNYCIDGLPHANQYGYEVTDRTLINIRLHYLELPLLAKVSLFSSQKVTFDMSAGPFIGYKLAAKQKTEGSDYQNTTSDYTRLNAGYQISFGFSVMKKRLFFEMWGSRGFVPINTADATKITTMQAGVAVGYYLCNGKKK